MFSFSPQRHLWRRRPNSLSTRESQLFSELQIVQRDSPLLKAWPKFLHSAYDFFVVLVLFAVLPKRWGSLLAPPLFNVCWVLISPLHYNFTLTSCVIWSVSKCRFRQDPVGYPPVHPFTFAIQVQPVSRPICKPYIECIELSERKNYGWPTTFNAKCLTTDEDCLTGNEDCLTTSKESNRVIH